MTTKNPKPLSEARDADARNSMAAMIRAAHKARQLSEQTQTPFVVVKSPVSSPVCSPIGAPPFSTKS